MPRGFPHQQNRESSLQDSLSTAQKLAKIDVLGFALLVLAAVSFTACFQQAGTTFPWNSAYVITLLVASVVLWVVVLVWERHVTLNNMKYQPVLPWRFLTDRVRASVLM